MVLISARKYLLHHQSVKRYLHGFVMASAVPKNALFSDKSRAFLVDESFRRFQMLDVLSKQQHFINSQYFSTSAQPQSISWECSSHDLLLTKLEVSLKDHKVDEAWAAFNDFKSLYGLPTDSLVSRLLTELAYSSDPHWLQNACNLVFLILKEKPNLLNTEILTKLSLSLARAHMPIPSSMILRVMLEQAKMPPVSFLRLIFLHMVKTEIGTCLASNILIQICNYFLYLRAKRTYEEKVIKADTLIFNLVLDACVRFKSTLKGQMLVEWMSRSGVLADAYSIISIVQIYQVNGLRDEINKFKNYIDRVSAPFVCHVEQFYDCLLNLHFSFDDLDAATELVLGMNKFWGSIPRKKPQENMKKTYLVSLGSQNLRAGLKLQIMPEFLEKDSVIKEEYRKELVISKNGKLLLSNKAMAKLIHAYRKHRRVAELSKVLLSVQKDFLTLAGSNLCSDVIDACICLGWLEIAHDILDDMETAGFSATSSTYMRLLTSYHSRGMFKEAEALQRQIRDTELLANLSNKMVSSILLSKIAKDVSNSVSKSDLADELIQVVRKEEEMNPRAYELNSSIYFFCQAKMMEDALKTYRRMQVLGIQPTVQTFAYLVCGYSSLEMYRDITILWGDIKRNIKNLNLLANRDLYELLLLNFIRGGYFERVMEVVGYMEQDNMYIDKGMYKSEFLKLHRNLYKGLRVSEARNEAQRKRLEFVQRFRKWYALIDH